MGIKTKTIAPFIAAAATAQGAYDEIAQECVADLAEELELKDLEKEVASRLNCASFKFKVVLAI